MTIGLTGGIGSGKSLISKILESLDYPVFNSDAQAKIIVEEDHTLKTEIIKLLGDRAYENDKYDRQYVSQIVFHDESKLKELNNIIHPAVRKSFKLFAENQTSKLIFNEAAILFETGAYKSFDKTILVCSDEETRLKRVMKRDKTEKKEVLARFAKQWSDVKKRPLADFVIENDGERSILMQLDAILKILN